jgi:tetratricopeptide (TPR) repeat protein
MKSGENISKSALDEKSILAVSLNIVELIQSGEISEYKKIEKTIREKIGELKEKQSSLDVDSCVKQVVSEILKRTAAAVNSVKEKGGKIKEAHISQTKERSKEKTKEEVLREDNIRKAEEYYRQVFETRDPNEKIRLCTQAIELNPNYSDAYDYRGISYWDLKQYDKAIADHTKAIEIDPKYADAYNNRGDCYFGTRYFRKAIDDYNKAIELKGNNAPDYYFTDLQKAEKALVEQEASKKRNNTNSSELQNEEKRIAEAQARLDEEKKNFRTMSESEKVKFRKSQEALDLEKSKFAKREEEMRSTILQEQARRQQAEDRAKQAEEQQKKVEDLLSQMEKNNEKFSDWEKSMLVQTIIAQIIQDKPKTDTYEERSEMIERILTEQLTRDGQLVKELSEDEVEEIKVSVLSKIDALKNGEHMINEVNENSKKEIIRRIVREINKKLLRICSRSCFTTESIDLNGLAS